MQEPKKILSEETKKKTFEKKGKIILISAIATIFLLAVVLVVSVFCLGEKLPSEPEETKGDFATTEEKETENGFHPSGEEETQENQNQQEQKPIVIPDEMDPVAEDDEMRGVYIATVLNINFPTAAGVSPDQMKKELDSIVKISCYSGFDTLFFQVRPTGDSFYPSEIFPTSRYLVENEGDPLTFDPFAYLIEKAAEYNMDVVAWVNPYRITNFKSESKEAALAALCDSNPAKIHPEWTVFYGGKLYYNPALPQVQDLIAGGVKEICEGYDVKGIIYDDYFYPYPVSGETFDDAAEYAQYGGGMSLEDWRRDNVNRMVKKSYDTVKGVSSEMTFGISPFGIWQNSSSDPSGSDTKGMEAYSSLYCDALAWIQGGYVDYIAPQIYWERGSSSADFATLTRWWSAQVDGTDVKLYISHAAYKVSEFSLGAEEITQQIAYSRSYMGVAGNIQYGFADIRKNTGGILDALRELYDEPYVDDVPDLGIEGVYFARPQDGSNVTTSAQFVSVVSDPRYPVYSTYGKVGRTKSGLFSVLMSLKEGENSLTFKQNGVDYTLNVNRVGKTSSGSAATLPSFSISSFTPADKNGVILSSNGKLPLTVVAPAGAKVTATLDGKTVTLKGSIQPTGNGEYLKEEYTGNLTVGKYESGNDYVSLGKITFSCQLGANSCSAVGPEVFVIPDSYSALATVIFDYSHLKISPTSSFYDDHTPASVGMADEIVSFYNGYYELACGAYIAEENVSVSKGASANQAALNKITSSVNEKECVFSLDLGAAPVLDYSVDKTTITVTLYSTSLSAEKSISLPQGNSLFQSAMAVQKGKNTVLTFELRSANNYYGFDYTYDSGFIHLEFRRPQSLSDGTTPLLGKTIVVDAGHGGSEMGAAGFLPGYDEKDLNLGIALVLADKLKALGATVVLSREDDSTVTLNERMALLTEVDPDFSVSVHHNSVAETKNANNAKGTWGLYWSPSGRSLSKYVQQSAMKTLSFYDYGAKAQKLALCRNHRFPQTLLEVGFICSPAEFQVALRSDYNETVAQSVVDGILNWYEMQAKCLVEESV